MTAEQRYKAYVSWCGKIGIVPAFFGTWLREVAKVPEHTPIAWRTKTS